MLNKNMIFSTASHSKIIGSAREFVKVTISSCAELFAVLRPAASSCVTEQKEKPNQ